MDTTKKIAYQCIMSYLDSDYDMFHNFVYLHIKYICVYVTEPKCFHLFFTLYGTEFKKAPFQMLTFI